MLLPGPLPTTLPRAVNYPPMGTHGSCTIEGWVIHGSSTTDNTTDDKELWEVLLRLVTPAQLAFVEMFGISKQVSSLTLSLYVLGYVSYSFFSVILVTRH